MVAVIKVSSSLNRILNYNENKVAHEKAVCLFAGNYPVDSDRMNFTMKQSYLHRRMELNTNVSRNSLHISLNFDTSENGLSNEKMADIARSYMQELGFGEQPYLVYRHFDAGHPHLHVVTTNIRHDGSRIDLHHLAIRKSEPARKKLEIDFGLVRAQGHKKDEREVNAVRVAEYGRSETRSAIQNVLEAVLNKYKYTTLSELNAVLGIYNVKADEGAEGSRISRHGGLLYRIVSNAGEPLGVPIKASLFHSRPTLARLEIKFAKNKITVGQHKARIKNVVDRIPVQGKEFTFSDMTTALIAKGITVVKRQSTGGRIYGLTYVDHQTGAVFNGSALGKAYSAKEMLERFPVADKRIVDQDAERKTKEKLEKLSSGIAARDPYAGILIEQISVILKALTAVEYTGDYLPTQYTRNKKRRRRGQQGNS